MAKPAERYDPDEVWSRITDLAPVAGWLRALNERWVRFHSLPESKRYADNDEEYEEILRRADSLIEEACSPGGRIVLVMGLHGEPGSVPRRDEVLEALQPTADYWRAVNAEGAEVADWPMHLWVIWPTYQPRSFDALIRQVADWQAVGVILVAVESHTAIHPYDGETDVILPTTAERDRWRERHHDWLSRYRQGFDPGIVVVGRGVDPRTLRFSGECSAD